MPVTVRDATDTDRAALEAMMAALQEVERALHPESRRPGAAMAADHLTYLLDQVAAHLGCCLIAEADGTAVGFLIAFVEEDAGHYLTADYAAPAHVSDLYVAEAWRGYGVVDALMDAAESHFRALGIRQMTIAYLAGNMAAERAYAKRGFAPYVGLMLKRLG